MQSPFQVLSNLVYVSLSCGVDAFIQGTLVQGHFCPGYKFEKNNGYSH